MTQGEISSKANKRPCQINLAKRKTMAKQEYAQFPTKGNPYRSLERLSRKSSKLNRDSKVSEQQEGPLSHTSLLLPLQIRRGNKKVSRNNRKL